ncbi:unnamed protein product [Microthlaspi erraticum]|uniref:F-box domain-containing protein n=1 Tax=Microthlaspi erraticum TaxID=1685480 RepID=A0A6D2I4X4_9BRAS|nr:unnamed protein product [Microthlaspi erraticum]
MSEICVERIYEEVISDLPNDLLIHILSLIPTKDAANTMLLSKRWRFLWTMLPKLVIDFNFADTTSLLKSIYNCKTLVNLTLSNKILVDVPSPACLPSLQSLNLKYVMYKDQDSPVRLLASCPILRDLSITRGGGECDNVTRFVVKVSSLRKLTYIQNGYDEDSTMSLVIDSPGLHYLKVDDLLGVYRSIQNTPALDVALVDAVNTAGFHANFMFLRSFSSVRFLHLVLSEIACCSGINFTWLIEFKLTLFGSKSWLEPLMLILDNSPVLKVLMIDCYYCNIVPLSWNKPSSVPVCLLSTLEILEWKDYEGGREENQFLAYILSNSKCLKTVGVSPKYYYNRKEIMDDIKSMYRVSASSHLLFSAQWEWSFME